MEAVTHCAKCGAELIGSRKFCAACGTPVVADQAAAPPVVASDADSVVSPFAMTAAPHLANLLPSVALPPNPVGASAAPPPGHAARPSARPPSSDPALPFARTADPNRPSALPVPSQVSPLAVSNLANVPAGVEKEIASRLAAAVPGASPAADSAKRPSTQGMPSVRPGAARSDEPVASSKGDKVQARTQLLGVYPPAKPGGVAPFPSAHPPAHPPAQPAMRQPQPTPARPAVGASYGQPPAGAAASPYAAPFPAPPAPPPPPALMPGARVSVAWSDGRRYTGTLQQIGGHQGLVVFPDGQQHWVGLNFMSAI